MSPRREFVGNSVVWRLSPNRLGAWTTRTPCRLIILCSDCHRTTHFGFTQLNGQEQQAFDYEPQGSLAAIVGVRGEIAAGDHRALYLAWLAGYGTWDRDESDFDDEDNDEPEPPVPAGLRTLTAPQRALADFLRLDDDLLAVAAETSPPLGKATDDPERFAAWVAKLPTAEKDRLLVRVAQNHAATAHLELLRRFRDYTTCFTYRRRPFLICSLDDRPAR